MKNMSLWRMVALVLLGAGVGVGIGATSMQKTISSHYYEQRTDECNQKYSLTNQSLDCENYEISSAQMSSLNEKLRAAITLATREKRVTQASIWVRNLATKQYAAVNQFEKYDPASLLKLPLAIAYYKFSQMQPAVLGAEIVYTPPSELNDSYNHFTAPTSLISGQSYTTEDLLARTLTASDNGAYFTLLHRVDETFLTKVMLDLGIQIPSNESILDFLTVKTYSDMLRGLYNASYISRTDAQKVLTLLSKTDFKGLAAPLPTSVTVAHKFGERIVKDQYDNTIRKELHDCGIVYKGTDPYIICIMTKGSDFDTLNHVIQDLSKITYDNI